MPNFSPYNKTEPRHLFLAAGNSLMQARQQAAHFLNTTQLVVYQSTTIKDEEIQSGLWKHFWAEMEEGIAANRLFCRNLLKELQETGLVELEDLLAIQPGYPSKLLHILTHMLDGFIGTDSVFYNLVEDSHWLSEPLRTTIQQRPENYWLVPVWHGAATSSLLHPEKQEAKELKEILD
ncbi:MAG: hypothetical protein Q7U64_00285 [Desulfocapsaceae bacterium]|nr:hypothetical protein [Desulfocapsaceae bacterium]